jgi:transposase
MSIDSSAGVASEDGAGTSAGLGAALQPSLFPDQPTKAPPAAAPDVAAQPASRDPKRGARLRTANRGQVAWGRLDLEAQLPDDHVARAIWAVLERLDLSALYASIAARTGVAGASAIDPKLLLALWVFATSEGESSGRRIAELCDRDAAYRWLCGGVSINHHTLTDFRSQKGKVLDQLITQILALLMKQDLVVLERIAQDGTRVRASAGAGSFRRAQTLAELMAQARRHLQEVSREADDAGLCARRTAARRRVARDRVERLQAALAQIPEVTETKKRSGARDTTVRVSTTDPDARVMKMGDGGFRPAFNVQFATTADAARVIVGVDVSNRGSDANQSTPMLEQIERRTGVRPNAYLVDGGYTQHEAIEHADSQDVTLYGPVPKPRKGSKNEARDPHEPRDDDSQAVASWRARMATDEAKQRYKQRAAVAETVNADAKQHRGLDQLRVRGTDKVLGNVLLVALTYNLLRFITLTTT